MNQNKQLFAEFLGTAGLLTVVVGSGIMGENLSPGQPSIALLANAIATGAGLYVLIQVFAPISGAHFNPVVSLVECLGGSLSIKKYILYLIAQFAGALTGVILAHAMFGLQLIQFSQRDRSELKFYLSELIATFGLIFVIKMTEKNKNTPLVVSFYILSAYWFTSSTSFANPAVTMARSLSNTFSGIHWAGVPMFIFSQLLGSLIAFFVFQFYKEKKS